MTEALIKVFFSYSHKDEQFKDELVKHLSILQREGVISGWHDRLISPGSEWDREIDTNLNSADIILLMVSSDFVASDYCWGVEVQKAMRRHEAGDARVIPVILRRVDWKNAPFAKFQALPKNAEPIKSWADQDEAFHDVAQGIKLVVNQLRQQRSQKTSASAHHDLGVSLFDQEKIEEAIAAFESAIRIDPNYAPSYNGLGRALHKQGKIEKAIASFEHAIRIDPSYAPPHNGLGNILCDKGNIEEAIAAFRKAIQIDPNFAFPHNNLGIISYNQGKIKEAIAAFRKAIQIDPNSALSYNSLGVALYSQGKVEEAISEYRRAIQIDPNFALPHSNLGGVLYKKGNIEEAISEYRHAIQIDPNSAYSHNGLGDALSIHGKLDEAIVAYRRAIQIDPNNAHPHNDLGVVLSRQGRIGEAVAVLRQAILINPDFTLAHKNLGNALDQQGKFGEAIAAYRRTLQIDPDDVDVRNNLSATLQKQRNLEGKKTGLFERFTEKAIKSVMCAQEESRRIQRNSLGTEQLLLGLIAEGTGVAAKAMQSMDISLKKARIEVIKLTGQGSEKVLSEIPFTPKAKLALEQSLDEANLLGHNYIGTEHLLLGLLYANEVGVAAKVLENLGIDLKQLRNLVYILIRNSEE